MVSSGGSSSRGVGRGRGGSSEIHRVVCSTSNLRKNAFARAHVLRTWGGIVDVTPDASPIVGLTPVDGLYLNCGWGTGGFKATPGIGSCFAHTIAHDAPHPFVAPFTLDRFTTGALVDEHGAAAVAH